MSSGKRKLSFLGFAPQQAAGAAGAGGEDEVRLDDEMERVVWNEGGASAAPPPLGLDNAPRRDSAAPPPYTEEASPAPAATGEGAAAQQEGTRHVQWDGAPPLQAAGEQERRDERLTRHLHPHKSRKYSLQEGVASGPGPGADAGERREGGDEELSEAERAELQAHRGERRPPALPRVSTVHVARKDGDEKLQALLSDVAGKPADREPHAVFVQLDELVPEGEGGSSEWRETARWIKYEEDVEEGSARWGRPHVASLSFHSLLNLRRCLETGVVLLDLPERDLPGAAWRVAQALAADGLIDEDDQHAVLSALLLRHHHVHDDRFRFSMGSRKHSSHTSLQSLWMEEGGAVRARCSLCTTSPPSGGGRPPAAPVPPAGTCRRHSALPRVSLMRSLAEGRRRRSSHDARKKSSAAALEPRELEPLAAAAAAAAAAADSREELRPARNEALMRRIPADAEATTVLVGAVDFLQRPAIAFVRLAESVPMPTVTEVPVPVRFLFVLLGPAGADLDYREVGRSISTLMSNAAFHSIAYRAEDRRELLSAINEFLDDSIVLPPGDWERRALLPLDELRAKSEMIRRRKRDALERRRAAAASPPPPVPDEKQALLRAESALPPKEPDDPLSRTGRFFGGVVRDMKRRYPHYVSDFTDALNGQCVAAAIFMYFAALSSAITFGGLLAEKTYGQIGISETLVFTSLGGVVFALSAGQPMMITGATGPLLLLDESLAGFCRAYGFDFLAARMYAGLWMIVIALAVACVEGSVAVKKITRFTEDIFAFLISLIFISEPITATLAVYRAHPLGGDYCADETATPPATNASAGNSTLPGAATATAQAPMPNTALWCTMLTLATFIIAYYLRIFRNGKFLGRSARRALGDFGVPIAIVAMVAVSCAVPVWTETLRVPEGLSPTAPRPWFVPLGSGLASIPAWAAACMVLPALMVYIIVFMETHIAELIVAKPERRLRKGSGFHMDIVLMSLVNALCGLFGAPWQCVATVRSVSHVAALTVMSTTHAPGDKPHIVEVKEQRLTGLVVALLVGASVLAARWLRLVPMAVLFGVFLYMGISALGGIQLWERVVLLLKPVKHHPQVPYVRRVPTARMHLYTLVQVAGLVLLYAVKSSPISLALPFFLVLMVPLRMALAFLFTPLQLRALDGAQKDIDEDDEPDFYQEAPLPG